MQTTDSRWLAWVAYDGSCFCGWQNQPNGRSVQAVIEERLSRIFKHPVSIFGAGRTDSGVHARSQAFHFDAAWPHSQQRLLRAIQSGMPDSIQIYHLSPVPGDFHARFSAVSKIYCYRFHLGPASPFLAPYCWAIHQQDLDVDAMNHAAQLIIGNHDFRAFAVNPHDQRPDDTVRTLFDLSVTRSANWVVLKAQADGFLFRMVRSLAGCLYDVGRAKLPATAVRQILQSRIRTALVVTAPPQGLRLESVLYPPLIPAPPALPVDHLPA